MILIDKKTVVLPENNGEILYVPAEERHKPEKEKGT
jgi:hypothetical protein